MVVVDGQTLIKWTPQFGLQVVTVPTYLKLLKDVKKHREELNRFLIDKEY